MPHPSPALIVDLTFITRLLSKMSLTVRVDAGPVSSFDSTFHFHGLPLSGGHWQLVTASPLAGHWDPFRILHRT